MKYIGDIVGFLEKLEENHFYYRLNKVRENSIMVEIAVPGERWEVEFITYDDKEYVVEVERFISNGEIGNEKELDVLFDEFSD